MRLTDLKAYFTQAMPLATGIYTGLAYCCPNDPRRKRAHAVLFDTIINPYETLPNSLDDLMQYLNSNESYRVQPKWHRIGTTLDTLTLTPSIAWPCCHSVITNGEVNP